jgi:hypothetical protein
MDTLLKTATTINGYNNVSNAKGILFGLQLGYYKELSNKFGFSFAVGYMNGTQVNDYTNHYLYESPATSYRNKIKTVGEETIKMQRITFTPQLFYFINNNFTLNVTLSNKGYNFNNTKNVSSEENSVVTFNTKTSSITQNSTSSKSSNLDLNLSVSNLSFGINYFFRPKQKKAQ